MERKIPARTSPPQNGDFWLTRAVRAQRAETGPEGAATTTHSQEPHLRHSLRRDRPIDALINYGMTYSGLQHVHDLSTTGALVEMRNTNLEVGTQVEFVLRYRYEDQPKELRLPATIKRVSEDGVASEFGGYDDSAYTDLVNLLYAAA